MSILTKKIFFPIFLCLATFILTVTSANNLTPKTEAVSYTLKSYKNTVALYKNEELITVYSSVVLNTLPEKDIQTFNSGISVATPTEAEILLEDYDG